MSSIAPIDPNESIFCEECGEQVKFTDYRLHCRTAHKTQKQVKKESADKKKQEYICHICKKSHSSRYNLNYHLAHHYNLKEFKCDLCTNAYNTQSDLSQHKRSHSGKTKGPFFCQECNELFEIQYKYEAHMNKHKKDKEKSSNECPICHRFFQSPAYLENHLKAHDRRGLAKRFECSECDRTFKKRPTLLEHIEVIHRGIKKYSCVVCGKKFGSSTDRRRHELLHERGISKTRWCPICKKTIHSEFLLHDQTFHPELRFNCKICQRNFPSSEALKDHHLVKHEQKKFICDLCSLTLNSIHAIRRHALLHVLKNSHLPDSQGIFSCQLCDLKSKHLSAVARHMVNVHEKDYHYVECDICKKRFGNPSYLAVHKKKVHSKENKSNKKIQKNKTKPKSSQKKAKTQKKLQKKDENPESVVIKEEPMEQEESPCDEIVHFEEQVKAEPIEFHSVKQEESDNEGLEPIQSVQIEVEAENVDVKQDDDGFESDWVNDYENDTNDSDWSEAKNVDTKEKSSIGRKNLKIATSEELPPERDGKKLLITCRVCCLTFTTVHDYEQHFIESHDDLESYLQCKDCILTFNDLDTLQKHFIQHHKIFKCIEKCRRAFSSKSLLDEHLKEHKKWNIILPCSYCDELFEGRHALLAHHEAKHANLQAKCDMCDKSYVQRFILYQHQRKYHTGIRKKHKCIDCKFEANKKEEIMQHFDKEHTFKQVVRTENHFCYICKIFVNNAMDLARHTYQTHDGLVYSIKQKCSLCREPVGKAMYTAVIHMALVHDNGKQKLRKCGFCKVEIELFDEYMEHISSHPGVFICPTCGEPFFTDIALKNHAEVHQQQEKALQLYECDYCGVRRRKRIEMEVHVLSVHAKYPPLHTCEFCGKGFKIMATLYAHRKFMHIGGSKKCTYCDKAFVHNHDLQVHIRTHTGEKPFVCEVCNLGFTSKMSLKSHHQRHSQTRTTYECTKCNISFGRNLKGLTEHNGKIHPEMRPFKCRVCSKTFVNEHRCRLHEEKHSTNNKSFNCDFCNMTFSREVHLRQHLVKHTGNY